ncbi:hypothetical protein BGX33_007238 [Mortierella sp. NVP41]|nr:hypothetical protein BGX33_007238 [Mortierella sp. NVP41]
MDATDSLGNLKQLIKAKEIPRLADVPVDELTLWKVSVPITEDNVPFFFPAVAIKKKLLDSDSLSDAFGDTPLPERTIHVLIECPARPRPALSPDLEIAALRQKIAEALDPSIYIEFIIKPEKRPSFGWSTDINTATLDDLKRYRLDELFPQYAHDTCLQILLYHGEHPAPEHLRDDKHLRLLLKIAKASSKTQWTVSFETPSKSFSAWTWKDVCDEYYLSEFTSDPGLEVLEPFTDIQSTPVDSDFEKTVQGQLVDEIEVRVEVLRLSLDENVASQAMVVASFLVAATVLFENELYFTSQREFSGRRGHGRADFSIHSRSRTNHPCIIGVTQVRKDNIRQALAENMVLLDLALTTTKRWRERQCAEGEDAPSRKWRSFGVVTDGSQWVFMECTLDENEMVSYRMSVLKERLNFRGRWQDSAKLVLGHLVWLWSRMLEEITGPGEQVSR